jgi:hypothetical protein
LKLPARSSHSRFIERIKPGHPHENGRHERMHLTLKKEKTRPPQKAPAVAAQCRTEGSTPSSANSASSVRV